MAQNILLMIADDLGLMAGCYGEPAIATPHLDRLAGHGVRFDMAFTSTASCSASRSVIYTGLHTHENGQYGLNHDHHHFMTFDHVETAPALLNDLGYLTGIIGKVHVGPNATYPWTVSEPSMKRDVSWVAQRSAAFFQRSKVDEQPFFLSIGFVDPHRDSTRGGFGNGQTYPGIEDKVFSPDEVSIPEFISDIPEVRQELAEYYRSVYRLDQGIGLVLGALDQAGLSDDTLICFVSDNGAPFLNSKATLYDAGVHLPLIIKMPNAGGRNVRGKVNPNLVSFTDLLPTFLDWAGASDRPPGARKGRSLLPILGEEDLLPDWQQVFGSHTFHEITNYYPTRFLRTPRYKYHRNVAWQLDFPFSGDIYGSLSWEGIRNRQPVMIGARPLESYIRRPPEELYDLLEDPREVRNLAFEQANHDLILEMRSTLEAWQAETNDPWLFRDGVSLRTIAHHLTSGLEVPKRFDFSLSDPGNCR